MSTTVIRIAASAVAAISAAALALALAAAPAGAAPRPCAEPYTAYVYDPLGDGLLLALDLDGNGTVCVAVRDDRALVVDDSDLAGLLPSGLADGLVLVDGPVTIDGTTVTIEDIVDVDQRGNRNNVVGAQVCSQNTGNSCFSNNKVLQHVKVVVAEDAIDVL